MKSRLIVALAGNPNSGKTTIFNRLTGARQRVGNYAGVTVEKKEGTLVRDGVEITFVDLPGTYSLAAGSEEERIARRFILEEKPDVVVHVVDSSNLERNLYLGVQLIEMGAPRVFAFNMDDLARLRGVSMDLPKLSSFLGGPIVPTVGNRGAGIKELVDAVLDVAAGRTPIRQPEIVYGAEMEEARTRIATLLAATGRTAIAEEARWAALKLLENDAEVAARFADAEVTAACDAACARLRGLFREEPGMLIAERRYGFISGACQEAVRTSAEWRHTNSDRFDEVLTHPVLGIPIFLGLMYLVFLLTFRLGGPPMAWLESFFGWLSSAVSAWWPEGSDSPLRSLLVDGAIAGVGGVASFLPNIVLLFMAIALLEDSGYMARAAFIMDRLMHHIGLHGKSFIPLLIGFGCSVPAILATRMIENRRDRLTTMMVIPLISCGARLPIYSLIIPAFFADRWQAPVLWTIYLTGILLAIVAARLLRSTLFRGEAEPLVMELPPYRLPTARSVLLHMWERGWLYVRKAGTLILAVSVVLWALSSYPRPPPGHTVAPDRAGARSAVLEHSFAGQIGRALEPALRPLGFDWRIGAAMIGAFAAKEVFVAQLGIVFAEVDADRQSVPLREKLRANYSPLSGFCMMLFMLIATPCVATVAAVRRETGTWRWPLVQLGGLTLLAYVLTFAVHQAGRLAGL